MLCDRYLVVIEALYRRLLGLIVLACLRSHRSTVLVFGMKCVLFVV